MKLLAWSHSRIKDFIKCRLMFWFKYVDPRKLFPYDKQVRTAAMIEGEKQHQAFEKRVRTKTPFPPEYAHFEPIAKALIKAPGKTLVELELTLDGNLKPCGWFDKTAYVRVIIDILKLNPPVAFAGDYKSGTPNFDEHQLKLTAAVLFGWYADLEKVTTAYIWLKTGIIDPKVYYRSQLPEMWKDLLVEPAKLQEAVNANVWDPSPSKRNCGYCVVNSKGLCEHAEGAYRGD